MEEMAAKIRKSQTRRSTTASSRSSQFSLSNVEGFDAALLGTGMEISPTTSAPPKKAEEATGSGLAQSTPAGGVKAASPPAAVAAKVIMQGYMQKKGDGFGFLSRWQHRFFILDATTHELSWYETKEK